MKIEFVEKRVADLEADVEIIFVIDKRLDHRWVQDRELLERLGFKGEVEETCLLPERGRLYVGAKLDHDEIRIAAAKAVRTLKKKGYRSAKVGVYIENCPITNIKAFVEGALLGRYSFDRYRSKREEHSLKEIFIAHEEYSGKEFTAENARKSIGEAQKVAQTVNFVRELVNTPPNEIYPERLAQIAQEEAERYGLECQVLTEEELAREGMEAILAVGRASVHKPRVIHLTYRPDNPKAKVVFVGKGLTYDSGGLSLKPSDYMVTMKSDKSGACTALGVVIAAKRLGLPVEVHSFLGAAENMVGGDAYKPDDIIRAKNGKTIEVRNTDAEGRLVLADTLCYAQEKVPDLDYIVDIATLTGACVVGLGEYTIGVMGESEELKGKILDAARASGELAAQLPFNRYLPKLLESKQADISNISSSRYGGAITAALFLKEFIEEKNLKRWVHLDIAGPAYLEKEWGYNPYGATGAGLRLAVKWLQKEFLFSKKHP
ncbi:MAG: leucyl aminopeptidase [Epsilonproteobacteria bacterium]|nr:leucyl aminopeptidase [Campylobacterota bacterium]NPA57362.1 leucyl aminopeptidase [Campylobacterota bacterium]